MKPRISSPRNTTDLNRPFHIYLQYNSLQLRIPSLLPFPCWLLWRVDGCDICAVWWRRNDGGLNIRCQALLNAVEPLVILRSPSFVYSSIMRLVQSQQRLCCVLILSYLLQKLIFIACALCGNLLVVYGGYLQCFHCLSRVITVVSQS